MILIVGGAGYIGSTVNKELTRAGFKTVVFDNLSTGKKELVKWGEFFEGDLGNIEQIREVFDKYPIEAVLHFAALKAVGESVVEPEKYYLNNVANTLNLFKVMREKGVNKFIFSSSAAVYGEPKYNPIDESHPLSPISPYGWNKAMVEQIMKDYIHAYDFKYVALRYFNACAAEPEAETGEWPGSSANLIPLVLDAAIGRRENIKIFGTDYPTEDGTCVRDYIHVVDLASAHILALKYLLSGGQSNIFNLGNGRGFSVREVINMVKKVTGVDFAVVEVERRPGDPPILIASSDKAQKELGWKGENADLEKIIIDAWNWHKKAVQLINSNNNI